MHIEKIRLYFTYEEGEGWGGSWTIMPSLYLLIDFCADMVRCFHNQYVYPASLNGAQPPLF